MRLENDVSSTLMRRQIACHSSLQYNNTARVYTKDGMAVIAIMLKKCHCRSQFKWVAISSVPVCVPKKTANRRKGKTTAHDKNKTSRSLLSWTQAWLSSRKDKWARKRKTEKRSIINRKQFRTEHGAQNSSDNLGNSLGILPLKPKAYMVAKKNILFKFRGVELFGEPVL